MSFTTWRYSSSTSARTTLEIDTVSEVLPTARAKTTWTAESIPI
eukprot:CAMPEP_0113582664 /NCGR_PEP_ID=MMETSP0015_2-20120614/32049_1 /TAXON_ID=2838 /ORGANISM="Odontella" /LENGTH=43 /DNA_ID=CAMNT_0000487379 /DNA_START=595 /DNA_END=723 /DNA_ORIENTATION=+ /assembly_acc=CAM_ASM_000160